MKPCEPDPSAPVPLGRWWPLTFIETLIVISLALSFAYAAFVVWH